MNEGYHSRVTFTQPVLARRLLAWQSWPLQHQIFLHYYFFLNCHHHSWGLSAKGSFPGWIEIQSLNISTSTMYWRLSALLFPDVLGSQLGCILQIKAAQEQDQDRQVSTLVCIQLQVCEGPPVNHRRDRWARQDEFTQGLVLLTNLAKMMIAAIGYNIGSLSSFMISPTVRGKIATIPVASHHAANKTRWWEIYRQRYLFAFHEQTTTKKNKPAFTLSVPLSCVASSKVLLPSLIRTCATSCAPGGDQRTLPSRVSQKGVAGSQQNTY